jgi:DNA processing protein
MLYVMTRRRGPEGDHESGIARMRRMPPAPASDIPYLVALTHIPGAGPQTVAELVAECGSAEAAWRAPLSDFPRAIQPHRAAAIVAGRGTLEPAAVWAALAATGVRVLILTARDYPNMLRQTAAPPIVLYVRGDPDLLHAPAVAVVGTRRMTRYGARLTRSLARDLALAGVTVVSGMARGVDTAAHEAALDVEGATAAVLGCGVDVAFPSSNYQLLERTAAAGVVVSEYPPGSPAYRGNFPARNRIIAGLSAATVVVEAGDPSGALITAAFAVDEGRSVCAVPGPAGGAATAGTHRLLRSGASAVASATEVIEDADLGEKVRFRGVGPDAGAADSARPGISGGLAAGDSAAGAVLSRLRLGPASVDELADALRAAPGHVNRCLTILELEGLARASGAGVWEAA